MAKTNNLRKLGIQELSLCTRPANAGSLSVLHKSDSSLVERIRKFLRLDAVTDEGLEKSLHEAEGLEPLYDALATSVVTILADESGVNKADLIRESVSQFGAALVKAALPSATEDTDDMDINKMSTEELQAELSKRGAAADTAAVAKAEEERVAAVAKVAQLEAERQTSEITGVAKAMVGDVGGVEIDPLVGVLKKLDPAEREVIKSVFDKANAVIKESALLKTHGKDIATIPTKKAELEKAADEVQKLDPKMTRPKAIAKALELNPTLYERP